jgi:putative hydrolase of the HAD superfamily
LDVDDTLVDNSVVPASVERACHAIAAAVDEVDAAALLRANTAAWMSYWPQVEGNCWLGRMDVLDVSREVWRRALVDCGHDDPSVVALAYETHQQIGREMDRLFDDVPDFLASLQEAGVATALVSNSSMRSQLARLETVGLGTSFDAVVISGQIGVAKPDSAIFEATLDRLQLTSAGVWHVGDSLSTDVAGAAAAGIGSVWLNRKGRVRGPVDPRPDLEVASLHGLLDLLVAG